MSELQDEADEILAEYYAVRMEFNRLDPSDDAHKLRRAELIEQYHEVNRRYTKLKELAARAGKRARLLSPIKDPVPTPVSSPEILASASDGDTLPESSPEDAYAPSTPAGRVSTGDRVGRPPVDDAVWQSIYDQLDAEPMVNPEDWFDTETPVEEQTPEGAGNEGGDSTAESKPGPIRVTAKYKTGSPAETPPSPLDEFAPEPGRRRSGVAITVSILGWVVLLIGAAFMSSLVSGFEKETTLRLFEGVNRGPLSDPSYGLYASGAVMGAGGLLVLIGALMARADRSNLPLHELARKGRVDALERALIEGDSVDAADETGHTALHHAVMARRREAVSILVAQGASLKAQNDRGDTALYMAAVNRDIGLVKYLLKKGGEIDTVNRNGSSLMHVAASMGDVDLLRFLDGSGLDVQIRSRAGLTPLHFAVESDSVDAVEYLLDRGVDPDAGGVPGESPICAAARLGHLRIVKMLIDSGANVELPGDSESPDPLAVAVEYKQARVAAYLRKRCKVS